MIAKNKNGHSEVVLSKRLSPFYVEMIDLIKSFPVYFNFLQLIFSINDNNESLLQNNKSYK